MKILFLIYYTDLFTALKIIIFSFFQSASLYSSNQIHAILVIYLHLKVIDLNGKELISIEFLA